MGSIDFNCHRDRQPWSLSKAYISETAMRKPLYLSVVLALAAVAASQAPEPAKVVVDKALAEAKASHRNVMVIFHASWCGWCKRMEAFLNDKELKPIFDKSFVFAHLDVLEEEAKKNLENAGGREYMNKWKGSEAGLPFFLILSPDGKVVVDSLRPSNFPPKTNVNPPNPDPRPAVGMGKPQNTGHPMAPEEVAWFMEMMYRGSTHMTDGDWAKIETWLKNQKKED